MNKIIFLCSSMEFYKELVEIEKKLISKGFIVNIPISAQTMKKNNDFEVSHFKGAFTYSQRGEFMCSNFKKITEGHAILVINGEKNKIKGYIGASVLMEIGIAAYSRQKVFIWNPIVEDASYKEELLSFGVEIIYQDLDKIKL